MIESKLEMPIEDQGWEVVVIGTDIGCCSWCCCWEDKAVIGIFVLAVVGTPKRPGLSCVEEVLIGME
jgi:hypothetical protein